MLTEQPTPTQAELNWAMLAHLSSILTAFVSLSTTGWGTVVVLLVPLGIYLYFRERSPYVAFHALQATAFQSFAGITFILGVAVTTGLLTIGWVITALLSIVLVGLLLIPFVLIFTVTSVISLLAWPVIAFGYTLRGGYLAYHNQPFEYPLVGELTKRAMGIPRQPSPTGA